jgi:hypothetical protein
MTESISLFFCLASTLLVPTTAFYSNNVALYQAATNFELKDRFHFGTKSQLTPINARIRRHMKRTTLMCSKDSNENDWIKTKFVDGNFVQWYNKKTLEIKWKRVNVWEQGSNFNLQSFVAEYGSAYFATAITLSIISYSTCYFLVTKSGINLEPIFSALGITGYTLYLFFHSEHQLDFVLTENTPRQVQVLEQLALLLSHSLCTKLWLLFGYRSESP